MIANKFKNTIRLLLNYGERHLQTDLRYFFRGGSWLVIGNVFSALAYFLLSLLFANLLSKEALGNYRYVLSLPGLIFTLSLTGMNGGIIQAVSRGYEGVFIKGVKMQLLWSVFPALLSASIALYHLLNRNYFLGFSLITAAVFTPFINSFNLYAAFLNGKQKFKELSICSMIIAGVTSLFLAISLLLRLKLELIVLVYFAGNALVLWALYEITSRKESPNNEVDESAIKYGKHASVMNICVTGAQYMDSVIVFHYLGAPALAIYYFATLIPGYSKDLFKLVTILSIPKLSVRNYEEIQLTIKRKLAFFFGIVIGFVVAYVGIVPFIFKIFFPQYQDTIPYAQVAGASLLFVISFLPVSIFNAQLLTKKLYNFNILSSIVRILFVFSGAYFWGLWGVIWAVVAYSGFYGIYPLYLILRK